MSNRQNFIELNGKRYDAHTGRVLEPAHHTKPAANTGKSKTIDGVRRRPHAAKKAEPGRPNAATAHTIHSKTERSKTLMRHAVKKPAHPGAAKHITKSADRHASAARAARANKIAKNKLVSRFGNGQPKLAPKVEPLAVREAPKEPMDATDMDPPILPNHTLTISPFEAALKKADSHKQPKAKKAKAHHRAAKKLRVSPKTLNLGAAVAVTLLIGGVMAYRSIPSLAVRLAASRAGIHAVLPGYQPAGFSLAGPVKYSSGQITIRYKANGDSRSFNLVQKKSDWNSQNLLENHVALNDESYQTVHNKGKTIYIYDDSNATWVSGGIWYQIEGESALNSSQLLNIADSL